MFRKLADVVDSKVEFLAELQTKEMGMIYHDSLSGMKGTSTLIRWFADNAERFIGDEAYEENGTT